MNIVYYTATSERTPPLNSHHLFQDCASLLSSYLELSSLNLAAIGLVGDEIGPKPLSEALDRWCACVQVVGNSFNVLLNIEDNGGNLPDPVANTLLYLLLKNLHVLPTGSTVCVC